MAWHTFILWTPSDVSEVPFAVTEVAKHFRPLNNGTLIINNGFDKETENARLENCYADRTGIAAGGIIYNVQPGTAAQLKI
jgi:hypothetical protein